MTEPQPNFEDREYLLSRYLDDDLTDAERAAAEALLRADPEAARVLEEYRRTDTLVRSLRERGPEVDWAQFGAEVRERREAQTVHRLWPVVYRWGMPLAAAAGLALVCTVYFRSWHRGAGPLAPAPTVMVSVVGPTVDPVARSERVAIVQADRTAPPGFVAATGTGATYAVAAAGVDPLRQSEGAPEEGSYF
jgi:anti-sigma factor RsiW